MRSERESQQPLAAYPALIPAFAKQILREPQFWVLQAAFAAILLWWRFAMPWLYVSPAVAAANPPWEFAPFWPALAVFALLTLRLPLRESSHGFAHRAKVERPASDPSFAGLRISVEAALCLLLACAIQVTIGTLSGGPFHVEHLLPLPAIAHSAMLVAAWVMLRSLRHEALRLVSFLVLAAIVPALWIGDRDHTFSMTALALVYLGWSLLRPLRSGRIDAIRDLG